MHHHHCVAARAALLQSASFGPNFRSYDCRRAIHNVNPLSHVETLPVSARWFRAVDVPERKPMLPNWKPSKPPAQWQSFAPRDSDRLEKAMAAGQESAVVGADGLLEVDIKQRLVQPTYWCGPAFRVVRGTWFYASGARPLPEQLAAEVERAWNEYRLMDVATSRAAAQKVKQSQTQSSAKAQGESPRYKLAQTDGNKYVVSFEQPQQPRTERLSANGESKVHATLYDCGWLTSVIQHLGGTKIVRGYFPGDVEVAGDANVDKAALSPTVLAAAPADSNRKVNHLVLCVHGVGQQLGARFESVAFAKDVNRFRDEITRTYNSSEKLQAARKIRHHQDYANNHGLQVLPVEWRREFNFNGEDSHVDPCLHNVKPEEMFPGDNILAQIVMDFLMYTQPDLRQRIGRSAVRCLNKQYDLFCQHNPEFAESPRVSIVGHSLGAVIMYDILRWHHDAIKFPVDKLFLLGSPVGMLELLHGRTLNPKDLPVNALYNVMRLSDPVATRLEPLSAKNAAKIPPKMIPGAGATIISQVRSIADEISQLSTSISSGTTTLLRALTAQPNASGAAITQAAETAQAAPGAVAEAALPNPQLVEKLEQQMAAFNRHNRLDFALPEIIDVSLIIGLAGHLTYFESPEVARFVLYELLQAGEAEDAARKIAT